jgi:formyltetrahydrofolate deformylase
MINENRYILTLSCRDVRGIVAAVTGFLAENGGFIIESAQFGDASTGQFFLRIEFSLEDNGNNAAEIRQKFASQVAEKFAMSWEIADKSRKSRVLILVSKFGHCLNDLLYRYKTGQLAIEIPAIISNHNDFAEVAKWHDIPFFYLPVDSKNKTGQEAEILNIIDAQKIDVLVLARYMQILSPELCAKLSGKAINIHHSFLPSFKGAKPYAQAFDRGVKLIGATAHYVTTDLDEGPIIEQEVTRVDHTYQPDDLASIGRDTECAVLARALKYHTEHRVLLNGKKTVVFK